jgi:DNA-binding response OmpR family regulator
MSNLGVNHNPKFEGTMTVLSLFGSSHVGARIIDRLSRIHEIIVVVGNHQSNDAVRLIADMKPEIVILDAQLGEGAGLEVLHKIKTLSSSPVVIMIATSPYLQYQGECMRQGADYFFQIPGEVEDLTNTVIELERTAAEAASHRK